MHLIREADWHEREEGIYHRDFTFCYWGIRVSCLYKAVAYEPCDGMKSSEMAVRKGNGYKGGTRVDQPEPMRTN